MGHMQTSHVFLGQLHSQTRAFVACFLAAYLRMMLHPRIIAILLLCLCHIAVNDIRIFAMSHQGKWRQFEDLLQSLTTIN